MTGGIGISDVILRLPLQAGEKLLLGLMENLARKSGLAYASIETYAKRIGSNPRTVKRLLGQLRRAGRIVPERRGGGRGKTTAYRLDLTTAKQGQDDTLSDAVKGDKSVRKGCQDVHTKGDKSGHKGCQDVTRDVMSVQTERVEETVSPPSSRALSENGDGNGKQNSDQRLVALAGEARGRTLTHAECEVFLQAVGEARAAGATEIFIAHFVAKTDNGTAVWTGPNAARDASRTLLDSYQAVVQLPEPRTNIAQILQEALRAGRYLAEHPAPDEGRHHNERVLNWSQHHAADLAAAGCR